MGHLFQQRTAVRVNSMLSAIEPKMIILQKESMHHGDVVDVVWYGGDVVDRFDNL